MRIVAVVPVYNEQDMIGVLVKKMNNLVDCTVVTDDHSTDKTVEEAIIAGACVVQNKGKRGFGSNSRFGIREAVAKGCDVVVTLDGDGQHDPSEVKRLLEPIEKGDADIVIGSRFLDNGSKVPRYRRFGIKVLTWICNVGSKTKFTDVQCCFRAYTASALQAMSLSEDGFTFSVELLIKARAMGFRIQEVPTTVFYHEVLEQNSTMNPIIQGIRVLLGILKVRFNVEIMRRSNSPMMYNKTII